jgi:hypothetical protein
LMMMSVEIGQRREPVPSGFEEGSSIGPPDWAKIIGQKNDGDVIAHTSVPHRF